MVAPELVSMGNVDNTCSAVVETVLVASVAVGRSVGPYLFWVVDIIFVPTQEVFVGAVVGAPRGARVGATTGTIAGASVGGMAGALVAYLLLAIVFIVGAWVGATLGSAFGDPVGAALVRDPVDACVGTAVGVQVSYLLPKINVVG
jgi:hypothetical protein